MGNFAFNNVPVLRHKRSRFDLSHGIKTSANVGDLVPFEIQEVVAGDTFKVKTSVVSRLSSQFFRPVMDNLFLDVYYFFVPSRLLYDKYVNVFGENTESAWANTVDYEIPMVPKGQTISSKTVADYLGLPVGNTGRPVSVLPFRAFAKIYDEWFRDQNNIVPMHIQKGEVVVSEVFNNNAWGPSNYMGKLPKVAKFHDYFTSSLPAPQKGSAVDLPLGGMAPVTGDISIGSSATSPVVNVFPGNPLAGENIYGLGSPLNASNPSLWVYDTGVDRTGLVGAAPLSVRLNGNMYNGVADLSQATATTVNDLRFAFQFQKMLERDARSGTRFTEYLQSHFGVTAGDYILQRSEFLGGRRTPLSIHQVTQTTGSDESTTNKLGEVGAYSLSNGRSRFTKSFVEPGFVIGVFCIRQHHSYQQGIEKFWTRTKRADHYDPVFANIGEQPVYKSELYGLDDGNSDNVGALE